MYESDLIEIIDFLQEKSTKELDEVVKKFEGTYIRLKDQQGYLPRFINNARRKKIPLEFVSEDSKLNRFLKKIFHIPMSPKLKEFFENYYAISKDPDRDLDGFPIKHLITEPLIEVNETEQRAKAFLHLLGDEAKKLAHYKKDDDTGFCKYALVGRPGTGKTAFINYIFSIYGPELDDKKVMYVRVNLNDVTQDIRSLRIRMLSKWIRIFAQFYFNRDTLEDFKDHERVCDEIRARAQKYKRTLFLRDSDEKFGEIVQHFIDLIYELHIKSYKGVEYSLCRSTTTDEDGKERITAEDLCKLVEITMSYAQKVKNWGNIFIFDGFDRVTFDKIQFDRFRSWCSEIKEITSIEDNDFCKSVFLIALRDYSIRTFFKSNIQNCVDNDLKTPNYRCLSIRISRLKDVVEKRFEYLGKKFPDIKTDSIMRNLINLLYMCYRNCDSDEALNSTWETVTNTFESVFAFNYRLLFKFLADIIKETHHLFGGEHDILSILQSEPDQKYLLELFKGHEWRILKLLIVGTSNVQPFKNRTSYTADGQPIFQGVVPIIPNIFNFNEYSYRTEEAKYYAKEFDGVENSDELKHNKLLSAMDQANKTLVKYHALSLLRDKGGTMGMESLVRTINQNFCQNWYYDLIYEIRELIYSNLISCDLDEAEVMNYEQIKNNYDISITPKANIIDDILETSVYYENIIDDTPIEKRFIGPLRPLTKIDRRDTWDYLKEKSQYIIYFICYIKKMQKHIESYLHDNEDDLFENTYYISPEDYKNNYLIINDKREELIKISIVSYLNGYLKAKGQQGANLIETWKTNTIYK